MLNIFCLFVFLLRPFLQFLIVDRDWYKRFIHFIVRKKGPRNRFKKIEMNLQAKTIAELQRQFEC